MGGWGLWYYWDGFTAGNIASSSFFHEQVVTLGHNTKQNYS